MRREGGIRQVGFEDHLILESRWEVVGILEEHLSNPGVGRVGVLQSQVPAVVDITPGSLR
jgi:hypothetical protein